MKQPTDWLGRWMRIIGAFYVFQFVALVFVRAPIRQFGPPGTLARAAAGDPTARFLVDSWLIFGFEVLAIGVALIVAGHRPGQAQALVWAVLGIELSRGIVTDTLLIAWGRPATGYLVWIVIHTSVIVTGLLALRAHHGTASGHSRKA